MNVALTRTIVFHATHRYFVPDWSAEQNRARFGDATVAHPHRYECAVTVSGPLDPETDMVVDLALLDQILSEEVRDRFDGKQLDTDAPEFAEGGLLPTCEALARYLFMRIAPRVPPGARLERVRVAEGPELYAECQDGEP